MGYKIFLAKAGEIYGPYTDEQFEKLESSGETQRYNWFWKSSSPGWQPLDPPPTKAPMLADAPTPTTKAPSPRAPAAHASKPINAPRVEVVCHDFLRIVSGNLKHVTDSSCELVSDHSSDEPLFAARSKVLLNLHDSAQSRTMNVHARITGMTREKTGWVYRLRWNACPEILTRAA